VSEGGTLMPGDDIVGGLDELAVTDWIASHIDD